MEKLNIFRIENAETEQGMWYNKDGELDPFITKLTEGLSAHLPMVPHYRYGANGKRWYSGCLSSDMMREWFSDLDAYELFDNGYRLYQFTSTEYQLEEFQTIFTREGLVGKEEIPLSTIFNLTK